MLVCSVVLRPVRGALAATIAETATALDTLSLGVIFATLTDNPGTAGDTLDGFVGKLMAEAASATDIVNAGSISNAIIVEETGATASPGATGGGIPVAMIEAAAADTVHDAVIIPVARDAMIDGAYINSDGTARAANVGGTMVNL